jgi:hydrogenase maturation protease
MKRIICIGNRYVPEDAAGLRVYDQLVHMSLPQDIEVIDGGLAGLDLLQFIEGAERVVFVDRIVGFSQPQPGQGQWNESDAIVVLDTSDVTALATRRYDHTAGLAYLLRVLPMVCEGVIPSIQLVGIKSYPCDEVVRKATEIALNIARKGHY